MKNRHIISTGIIWANMLLFFCSQSIFPSYAGGINGNEQAVVSTIHGQFERDGVIYQVKPEYINSALGYLQQDDVDLTPEQAQSVISEIYSNVSTGVESGYLVEVGRTGTETEKLSDSSDASDPNKNDTNTNKNNQANNGGNSSDTGTSEGSDPEDLPSDTGEPGSQDESLTELDPVKPDIPKPVPIEIKTLELVTQAPSLTYDYISKDTDELMGKITLPYGQALQLLVALLIIAAVILLIALWKHLFNHHHNRKLRKILKYTLSAEVAVFAIIAELTAALWIGAFHEGVVLNNMNDTSYYHQIHTELKHDTSISFALMNIPDAVMEDAITYERVVLAARQQVENNLLQGNYQANTALLTDELKNGIEAYLESKSITLTEKANTGLNVLMERLDSKYNALLQWPFSPWWLKQSKAFADFARLAIPISVLSLLLAQVMIIFLNHYKYKGLKQCGIGILSGSAAVSVSTAAAWLWYARQEMGILPDYMGEFFQAYLSGILRTGMILGGIGILIGVAYILAAKSWKEGKR